MNERTVQMVALLSFTGEEGFMRRGRRFLVSKSRAEFLSNPIKGERQALAQVLYDTMKPVSVIETKSQEKPENKKVIEDDEPKKKKRRKKKVSK